MNDQKSFFDLGEGDGDEWTSPAPARTQPPARRVAPKAVPASKPSAAQSRQPVTKPAPKASKPSAPAPTPSTKPFPAPAPASTQRMPTVPRTSGLPTTATAPKPAPKLPTSPAQEPASATLPTVPVATPASSLGTPPPAEKVDDAPASPVERWDPPVFDAPQNAPAVDEADDDEDFIPAPKPSPKRKSTSTKNQSKGRGKKKGKPTKEEIDEGDKKKANIIRWVVLGAVGLLVLLGVKSIIFPPSFPSAQQVFDKVQEGFGVTDFPAENATAFVTAFTTAYLTVPEGGDTSARQAELANYVPDRILSQMGSSTGNVKQSIVQGPFVSGVRYISDTDAVFTMSSKLNNGVWVYLEVPVYYNPDQRAFAVSGAPGIVSAPRLSEVPANPRDWSSDDEAAADLQPDLERFFQAWSDPELTDLNRYAPEGGPRVMAGIEGVRFRDLRELEVSPPMDEDDPRSTRTVYVNVTWEMIPAGGAPEGQEVRPTQYTMSYEMLVQRNADNTQWNVMDIRAGVRSTSGAGGGDGVATPDSE